MNIFKDKVIVKAINGNRTHICDLRGRRTNHYTIIAQELIGGKYEANPLPPVFDIISQLSDLLCFMQLSPFKKYIKPSPLY